LRSISRSWGPALVWAALLTLGCIQDPPNDEYEADMAGDTVCQSPPCSPEILDMTVVDTEPPDGPAPDVDMAVVRDAQVFDSEVDATSTPCEPVPMNDVGGGLGNAAIKSSLSVGGPVSGEVFMATDLDGDRNREVELIIARGGRLEVMDGAGRYWWLSEALDVRSILDVIDLDGDGRLEVVATSTRDVLVFDGLSGELRWSLPDDVLGDTQITAVTTVLVGDFTGEEIPDLYITDSGCGTGGTGRGAVFTFSGPEFGIQLSTIEGPRQNGRCTRWHTLSDLNEDGRKEILITDGLGLSAVDALTGDVYACGTVDDAPSNGPLPILPFNDGGLGWFAFLPDRVLAMRLTADTEEVCAGDFLFTAEWSSPPADAVSAPGSSIIRSAPDDVPTLLTSEWSSAENHWSVVSYAGGQRRLLARDALLNAVHPPDANGAVSFVAHVGVPRGGRSGPSPCAVYEHRPETGETNRARELGRCAAVRTVRPPADRSSEFAPQVTVSRGVGPEGLYVLSTDRQGVEHPNPVQLMIGRDRGLRPIELPTPVGAAVATCPGEESCTLANQDVLLAYATTSGWIGFIDSRLALVNEIPISGGSPTVKRPAGIATARAVLIADQEHLAVLNRVGTIALFDPEADTETPLWTLDLGRPSRGSPILEVAVGPVGDDLLLVRDVRLDQSGISVIDAASGEVMWTHNQPIDSMDTMRVTGFARTPEGWADTVLRYDRIKHQDQRSDDARCPADIEIGDLLNRDPECPDTPLSPLVVTALDPLDGTCRWRAVVRPTNPCTGPGNQSMTIIDGVGNEAPRVFITESSGVRAFSVSDGRQLAHVDLGTINGNAGRGGGWIRRTEGAPPWIRVAGNGPPEAYNDALELIWRATGPEGLRSQSWIRRDGLVVGDAIWITPGTGWPIYRYALGDGQLRGLVALQDGAALDDAEPSANYADVLSMVPIDDVDGDGGQGVLVSTNEGRIYGLRADGRLAWSRQHETNTGTPVLLNGGGESNELAVPIGNGQIQIWRAEPPASPPLVWDVPCPAPLGCDPDADIDASDELNWLCAQWIPIRGVDGYEYRVIGTGGAPMTAWRTANESSQVEGVVFGQQPGPRYRFQIRSFILRDGVRVYSNPTSSDGVILNNAQAPAVEVRVEPRQLEAAVGETMIRVIADDDDRITGWRLDVVEAESGEHIRNLAREAVIALNLDEVVAWYGLDRLGLPAMPGRYLVEASVVDRSGNVGVAAADLIICDGPCP